MNNQIETETIQEAPFSFTLVDPTNLSEKEIMTMKKEERRQRYINYQGELDIELFNTLRNEKLATYKLNPQNTDTIWDMEALKELTLNNDVDREKMKEFLMPNRDITYQQAEYLLSSNPNHLIATMTILSSNYQMNIYEIDKNLSVDDNGYNSYANFLFTREEEIIFLTGRTLLSVYADVLEMRRDINEEKTHQEVYILELISEIDGVICRYNKGLVRTVASPYRYQADDDDLIGSGFEGIIKEALPKFDIDTGNKFSTFATWWIRNETGSEANGNTTIYIPDHMVLVVSQVLSKQKELEEEMGETFPIDVVINLCRKEHKYFPKSNQHIKMAIEAQKELISLDEPERRNRRDDGDGSNRYSTIPDRGDSVEDIVIRELDKEMLYELFELANLSIQERRVLEFSYSLQGKGTYTAKEIGNKLGMDEGKIKRTKSKAMDKLKKSVGNSNQR